jgi:cell wall-associated NlpC family hydrolase
MSQPMHDSGTYIMNIKKISTLCFFIAYSSLFTLTCQSAGMQMSTAISNLRGTTIEVIGEHYAKPLDSNKNKARNEKIVNQALNLAGTQYKFGGNNPETGFDCSGFVRYVYKQAANITLARTASAMSKQGESIQKNALQAGDLVFFNTTNYPNSHVGIYLGDNQIIHAPRTGRSVSIESIQSGYWAERYNGAKRF